MYSFEVIEYILKKGKDILDIDVKDNKGITALHDDLPYLRDIIVRNDLPHMTTNYHHLMINK